MIWVFITLTELMFILFLASIFYEANLVSVRGNQTGLWFPQPGFPCAQSQQLDRRWSRCALAEYIQYPHFPAQSAARLPLDASSTIVFQPQSLTWCHHNKNLFVCLFVVNFPFFALIWRNFKPRKRKRLSIWEFGSVCRSGGEDAMAVAVKTALALLVIAIAGT